MQFDLRSEWRLYASVGNVWQAQIDVQTWPLWWPGVAATDSLRDGDVEGLGARHRVVWRTALRYRIAFETETVALAPMRLIGVRASGELEGLGTWLIEPCGADSVVRFRWQVRLMRSWMRLAAPLLGPIFVGNHNVVMDRGRRGLAALLSGAPASQRISEPAA